jgi:RNA polymerase sigma factor (sigma-70 family)
MRSYQILAGFNKKDPEFIATVWNHYSPFVLSITSTLTHGSPDARDLTSETLEKLLGYNETFESMQKIRSFLLTVAKNKCKNYLNRQKLKDLSEDEFGKHYQEIEPEDMIEAETVAYLRKNIYDSIEDLPPKCKEIFMLWFTNGLKNREIAERLDISEKTVEKQKTKAFRILRMDIRPFIRFIYSIIFL